MALASSSESNPLGGRPPADREIDFSASMFTDLGRSVGPLEAVERLQILETLSYGVLYEGRMFQASRSESISLLELNRAFEREPLVLARLLAELAAAARLQDPGILSPRGVFRHAENLYVLLDSCPGVSLATAFEFLGRSGLRLSSEAVLRIGSTVLAALELAAGAGGGEEEPSHGLLTPENVFIGEGQAVRVRGFGFWPAGIGRTGLLGPAELRYIASSQRRTGVASPRTDLFSLGAILFEAILGFPAFDGAPEEEDLTQLRVSVEDIQRKDSARQDLLQIMLGCLTPQVSQTRTHRARLRKAIDTLFVREVARDRPFGSLTLDDLVTRIKQRRPAIVKAMPLSLTPAETPRVESPAQESDSLLPEGALEDSSTVSVARSSLPDFSATISVPRSALPEESSTPIATPEPPTEVVPSPISTAPRPSRTRAIRIRRPRVPFVAWMFVGAVAAVGAFIAIFWSAWPHAERSTVPGRPTIAVPEPLERQLPAALPPPALSTPPLPAVTAPAASRPTAAPLVKAVPSVPTRAAPRVSVAQRRPSPAAPPRPRRAPADSPRPHPPAMLAELGPAPRPPAIARAGEAPALSSFPSQPPSVSLADAVAPETKGLVAPVLIERPDFQAYVNPDGGPVERSVTLEILVNDLGRVRGSRVLRAEHTPPGFFRGLEKYLATLRFRPAEMGGVPVKVWMQYELRYLAQ